MRACFTNFITIRDRATSKSGLYVNDLSGVTTELFDKLKTSDDVDIDGFYTRFYERSVNNFITTVTGQLGTEFYNYKVIESRITGEFDEGYNTTTEEYAGVQIWPNRSKYLEHQVLRIKFNVEAVASPVPDIYVFDKVGGNLIDTITLESITEGENEVQIYNTYDSERLYIAFKPSEISLKETKTYDRHYDEQPFASSVSQVNGGGLIVEFNSVCSPERFICSRLQAFKYAFWHFLGLELMKERILTDKINKFTILSIEQAERLGDEYQKKFDDALKAILQHHRVSDDKLCFECRGAVSRKTLLP